MEMLDIILLVTMTAAAAWTVMTRSLLKSTIGLAATSVTMAIIMFRLDSPLAAVFELSVCTGLITAVFVSTISLVRPLTHKDIVRLSKDRIKRFWYLPFIMICIAGILVYINIPLNFKFPLPSAETDPRNILWNSRQLDLFGQIVMLLLGAFGTLILFREAKKR